MNDKDFGMLNEDQVCVLIQAGGLCVAHGGGLKSNEFLNPIEALRDLHTRLNNHKVSVECTMRSLEHVLLWVSPNKP